MSDAYTKGFNEGYVIAAHLPEIARYISKIKTVTPRLAGFRDGRRRYVFERWLTRYGLRRRHARSIDGNRDAER